MATRLIMIRHGETVYTKDGRYCGWTDASLSAAGIEQAISLRKRFKDERIDAVYTSDLKRCLQTSREIFKGKAVRTVRRKGLREIYLGEWEGLISDEIMLRHKDLYRRWIDNPQSSRVPSGESLLEFQKRVLKVLGEILAKERERTVAVVAHGGTCRLILLQALGATLKSMWAISQDPSCVNIVDFHDRYNVVTLLNDTSHLRCDAWKGY